MSSFALEAHIHAGVPLHAQRASHAVPLKHARRMWRPSQAWRSSSDPQGALMRPCFSAQRLRAGRRERRPSLLASIWFRWAP